MHHQQYCRPFGIGCEDREKQPSPQRTGGRFLSFVLGTGLHAVDQHLKPAGVEQPLTELDTAYEGLEDILPAQVKFGGPISANNECQDVIRGSLALYGTDQVEQARKLLALISTKDNFVNALVATVQTHFNDPDWEPFRD